MSHLRSQSGTVRVTFPANWVARAFGLPFLAAGLWLGYHFVAGLAYLVMGQSDGLAAAFGLLVLLVMVAAFLVPGWLLVFTRATVLIDRLRDSVTEVRHFLVYTRRTTHRLSAFTAIEVFRDRGREQSSRRRRVSWDTALVSADGARRVLAAMHDEPEAALRFGRELGGLVGLPVHDRTGGDPSHRDEDDEGVEAGEGEAERT